MGGGSGSDFSGQQGRRPDFSDDFSKLIDLGTKVVGTLIADTIAKTMKDGFGKRHSSAPASDAGTEHTTPPQDRQKEGSELDLLQGLLFTTYSGFASTQNKEVAFRATLAIAKQLLEFAIENEDEQRENR